MVRCDLSSAHQSAGSDVVDVKAGHGGLTPLKQLVQQDPAFAEALRATNTTEDAAHLAARHGIAITPETLWRNRGTLVSGGKPTWPG